MYHTVANSWVCSSRVRLVNCCKGFLSCISRFLSDFLFAFLQGTLDDHTASSSPKKVRKRSKDPPPSNLSRDQTTPSSESRGASGTSCDSQGSSSSTKHTPTSMAKKTKVCLALLWKDVVDCYGISFSRRRGVHGSTFQFTALGHMPSWLHCTMLSR